MINVTAVCGQPICEFGEHIIKMPRDLIVIGIVAELGTNTHDELMKQKGVYADTK
jgi:hypothetical protein